LDYFAGDDDALLLRHAQQIQHGGLTVS